MALYSTWSTNHTLVGHSPNLSATVCPDDCLWPSTAGALPVMSPLGTLCIDMSLAHLLRNTDSQLCGCHVDHAYCTVLAPKHSPYAKLVFMLGF